MSKIYRKLWQAYDSFMSRAERRDLHDDTNFEEDEEASDFLVSVLGASDFLDSVVVVNEIPSFNAAWFNRQ